MGTVFKVAGDLFSGWSQYQAGQFNAEVAQRNSQLQSQQAADEAAMQSERAYETLGAARAAYGASGVTTEGSPLAVLAHSARRAELDKQNIIYKGRVRAQGLNAESDADKQGATAALIGGGLKAGGDAYDGMAKASAAKGGG